jgi:hypothetical protein
MTTSTTVEAKSAGLGTLAFARRFTEQLLEGIPQDKITFQPFDGANHVLWNIASRSHGARCSAWVRSR